MNTERSLLITILNTMYNDNLRQIENLQASNIEIRRLLINYLQNGESENNTATNNTNNNTNNRTASNYNYRQSPSTALNDFYNIMNTRYYYPPRTNTQNNSILNRRNATRIRNRINQNDLFTRNFENFFEPIEIYPTPEQIENATRVAYYNDIVNPTNQSCPISLVPFNDNDLVILIRFCGHIFNREELYTWFRSSCRCPVCRYDIRDYRNDSLHVDNQNQNESQNQNQNQDNERNHESTTNENNTNEENSENDTPPPLEENNNTETILNSLTETIISNLTNTLLNNYTTTGNNIYGATTIFDIIYDMSFNPVVDMSLNQPVNTSNIFTRYYTLPNRNRE